MLTRSQLDVLEKFYICRETQRDNQINDKCTVGPNVKFVVIAQYIPPLSRYHTHTHTLYGSPQFFNIEVKGRDDLIGLFTFLTKICCTYYVK